MTDSGMERDIGQMGKNDKISSRFSNLSECISVVTLSLIRPGNRNSWKYTLCQQAVHMSLKDRFLQLRVQLDPLPLASGIGDSPLRISLVLSSSALAIPLICA